MCPCRSINTVNAFLSDDFMKEESLRVCGMNNFKLFYDHYHLKDNFIRDHPNHYTPVEGYVCNILYASSSAELERNYNLAIRTLQNDESGSSCFRTVYSKRHNFVSYIIDSIVGTNCTRGSTFSEQNYSSTAQFLRENYCSE